MTRGPKKHLKRINAPKAWLLDKMGGIYVPLHLRRPPDPAKVPTNSESPSHSPSSSSTDSNTQ